MVEYEVENDLVSFDFEILSFLLGFTSGAHIKYKIIHMQHESSNRIQRGRV